MTVETLRPVPDHQIWDQAAEEALLAAAMIDATVPTRLADDLGLTGAHFHLPRHEDLWHTLRTLAATGQPTSPIAAAHELRRRGITEGPHRGQALEVWLVGIYRQAPAAAQAAYYARIVLEHAHARRTDQLAIRLHQLATAPEHDPARIRAEVLTWLDDQQGRLHADDRLIPAGEWIFNAPDVIPAAWGKGDDILWARGETCLLVGPQGVGKTTLGQQLTLARIGALQPVLLDLPVEPAARCLYLAMDRPEQARRSLARMVTPDTRQVLNDRLVIWKGPPPGQLVNEPRLLLDLADRAGLTEGDFVVIDSIKDVAIGIASDEVGAAVNTALQHLLAAGIDVLGLHHIRKADSSAAGKEPQTIDEVYGSTWITSGAGSVISLWGAPGDPIVSLRHMKQPATEVGPFKLRHDQDTGRTEIHHGVDLIQMTKNAGIHGLSADVAAMALFGRGDNADPTPGEIEKARRRLDKLVRDGVLHREDGARGRGNKARWYLATHTDRPGERW